MPVVDYDDGSRLIEVVPIYHQGNTDTCAQACVTSILNYWGYPVKYEDIIAETSGSNMVGMSLERIMWYFRKYNLQAQCYTGNLAKLKALVDRGYPSVVSFDEDSNYHVIVVVGYNDHREVMYYIDSMYGELTEEPYSDFSRAWSRQRRVSGFMDQLPPNQMIEVRR